MRSFRTGAKFINLTLSEIAVFLACGKTKNQVGGDPKFYFIYQANITYTFFF